MGDLQCAATILLARHAEADYETSVWADVGGSLTPRGRAQARGLAQELSAQRVAHVWCSTLSRAVQTAEIVAGALGVGVTAREGLREFRVGDLAGRPLEEDPFAPWFSRWLEGDLAARVPGGESGLEVRDRFRAVLAEVADAHRGETVLVVAHGGVLRSMVPQLCRMEVEPDRTHHCSTIEVAADGDGWVCRRWTPHRPA